VKNTDCVICSDSVDREITESSEVQQLKVQLYQGHGRDYSRSNCYTADDSNCNYELCEYKSECAINSLYSIRREVTCCVAYTQHVTVYIYIYIYIYIYSTNWSTI
jgi:hypothetical protein